MKSTLHMHFLGTRVSPPPQKKEKIKKKNKENTQAVPSTFSHFQDIAQTDRQTASQICLLLLCATVQQSYSRHAGVRRP